MSSSGPNTFVGGLVGYNFDGVVGGDFQVLVNGGSITQSYASGSVSATGSAAVLGGLVGHNGDLASVGQSYATGAVTGGNSNRVGGLVGENAGTITETFASGAVSGGTGSTLGGLVGVNSVTFPSVVVTGTVSKSYWDKGTTGQNHSAGSDDSFGLSTQQSFQQASYIGWTFSTDGGTWFMIDGKTRPFLQSEYSTTITNTHQLQLMAMDLDAHYTLANNISFGSAFSNPSDMWSSQGFVPVGIGGQVDRGFAGVFNGKHHTIDGLTMAPTDPGVTNIGLFGMNFGTIKNVQLTNVSITANPFAANPLATGFTQFVGALAGQNFGTIKHVAVTGGTIDGGTIAGVAAGGLVGQNGVTSVVNEEGPPTVVPGKITHSTAAVTVTVGDGCFNINCSGGTNYAGGLVGINGGIINHSSAAGAVTSGSQSFAGGLVGQNVNFQENISFVPVIKNSFATGDVTSAGTNVSLGGLVGANGTFGIETPSSANGVIKNSYANGHVSATANVNNGDGDCNGNCQFVSVGGLVGENSGLIVGQLPKSHGNDPALGDAPLPAITCGAGATCAGGTVAGGAGAQVGGLVGDNEGLIKFAYATGDVHVGSNGTAGGLVGFNTGTLRLTFAAGTVTGDAGTGISHDGGPRTTALGGLVGNNLGVIKYSFAVGDVGNGHVDQLEAGGLVGDNGGTIRNAFAIGNVSAGNNSTVGGLAANNNPGNFNCDGCDQGIGQNDRALISRSFSVGTVTAGADSLAGGLVGGNSGTINRSASTGNVTAGHDSVIGGLVAFSDVGTLIKRSTASGTVTSTGANSIVGGFIGGNGGQIVDSHALGGVNGTSNSFLGGFVGINIGSVQDSTAAGNVTGSGGGNIVGGFVGVNAGMIDPSFSSGTVGSGPNSIVGAFAGSTGPFTNLPANVDPNLTFPGTIDSASGSTSGQPNVPQIGSNSASPGNAGLPFIVPEPPTILPPCGATACQIIVAGLQQPPPPDTPNTTPTFDQPPPQQPLQQVAAPTNSDNNNPIQINFTTSGPTGPTGGGTGAGGNGGNNGGTKPNYGPSPGPGVGRTADEQQFSGVPPPNETRFRNGELVIQVVDTISVEQVVNAAAKLGLVFISSQHLDQTHRIAYRFRATARGDFRRLIVALEKINVFASVQPNYVFIPAQSTQAPAAPTATPEQTNSIPPPREAAPDLANSDTAALQTLPAGDAAQYVIAKLHLGDVHRLASGRNVTIAVVDSEIDVTHPDLRGVIVERFDATQSPSKPHAHGTGMAGAIASRFRLLGVAPGARILAIKAFDDSGSSAESSSYQIVKGLDYAIAKNVRIINMSFAGPRDPMMERTLKSAHDKGIILIAAAGNAGPKSAPLYPGADQSVIAVSASDFNDKPFAMANRGKYIAVAAPGVDVMVPAPGNTYQLTTGTSVAAAHVSGVAALLVERKPTITPDEVRALLMKTATAFSAKPKGEEDGAGLVDPVGALQALAGAKTSDAVPSRSAPTASVH